MASRLTFHRVLFHNFILLILYLTFVSMLVNGQILDNKNGFF
jgi:hypothetical protein